MAEIFLSYQKKDRDLALRIIGTLTSAGFSIWWDDEINPRENWDREIEREHGAARTVLVLWTRNSVESEWVRAEALSAKDARPRKLIQARFDGCNIPMAFTYVNYVDLARDRPTSGADWAKLVRWLKAGEAQDPPPADRPDPEPEPPEQPVRLLPADRRASPAHALVLALFIIIFSAIVGFGWFGLLSGVMSTPMAVLSALLITMVATLLGRLIGRQRIAGGSLRGYFLLYPFLVAISTVGTLNAAFQGFESARVLREEIDHAQLRLSALDRAAQTTLANDAVNRRTARVEALLVQLSAEIRNSVFACSSGPGPAARVILAEIDSTLPGFAVAPKTDTRDTCDDITLARYAEYYESRARSMLQLNPEERKRARLRMVVTGRLSQTRARLAGVEMDLERSAPFYPGGRAAAQSALENAARVYSEGYESLAAVRPGSVSALEPAIDVDRVRRLGSITAFSEILSSRLGYPSTWAYLLVALLLDLLLIFQFAEGSRRTLLTPADTERGEDLQFLWVDGKR